MSSVHTWTVFRNTVPGIALMSSVHTWTVFRGAAVAVMMDVKGFTVEKALWDGEELAVIGHKVSHLRRCLCARSCLPPHPGRNPGQRPGCRTREGAGIGSVSRMQDRESALSFRVHGRIVSAWLPVFFRAAGIPHFRRISRRRRVVDLPAIVWSTG